MSILERPYALASLTESLAGSVVYPDHPAWDDAREEVAEIGAERR